MSAAPAPEELSALIRLLDDETPVVRTRVSERIACFGGDISEWLASQPHELSSKEKKILAEMLSTPRREALAREWVVPTGGSAALEEDWESFESLLQTLSDFLHDGITLRQPLPDALDLLAEEAVEDGVLDENDLRAFLFESDRLKGNQKEYYDPRNSDLAWAISEGRSNPLGLCLIYMLIARRLELEVEGINFPGHFLCRIHQDGYPLVIDCFDGGRLHLQSTLLENAEQLSKQQKIQLKQTAGPGTIIIRLLNNLSQSLKQADRQEDALLIQELRKTLG